MLTSSNEGETLLVCALTTRIIAPMRMRNARISDVYIYIYRPRGFTRALSLAMIHVTLVIVNYPRRH